MEGDSIPSRSDHIRSHTYSLKLGTGLEKDFLPMLFCCLAGVFLFFIRFESSILNPSNIDWILGLNDGATHFISWGFFKDEPWGWPLGKVQGYFAPVGTSIGLTDSLPLLAIPFKAVSFFLPAQFQYFGIWLLINHVLQALFGYLLLATQIKNKIVLFLGSFFFLLSPIMLVKHEQVALSSHWIIIAALWLYFITNEIKHRSFIRWSALLFIASLVHPYLAVLPFLIFSANLLKIYIMDKSLQTLSLVLGVVLVVLAGILFNWYVSGYFLFSGMDSYSSSFKGFEDASMNLNALYNQIMKEPNFPLVHKKQAVGYNYLGLGMISICVIALVTYFCKPIKFKNAISSHTPLLLLSLLLMAIALSNKITFNDRVIFWYHLPQNVEVLLNVFHAAGRFFWPVYYLIILFSFLAISQNINTNALLTILVVCLCLQVYDLRYKINKRKFTEWFPYTNELQSEEWNKLLPYYVEIKAVPPFLRSLKSTDDYKYFSMLAMENHSSVNMGYVARHSQEILDKLEEELKREVTVGPINNRSLYLFDKRKFLSDFKESLNKKLFCGEIDGYVACIDKETGIHFMNPVKGKMKKIEG